MFDDEEKNEISDEWSTIGLVIDNCNRIETKMKEVIVAYLGVQEDKAAFLQSILLHNSIVSFASKVKLILAINKQGNYVNIRRDDFHKLMKIRNAYAHSDLLSNIEMTIPDYSRYLEDESLDIEEMPQPLMLKYLKSIKHDGSLEVVERTSAYFEFFDLSERVEEYLNNIKEKIGS
ncbi:MAG: hypothetical protein ABII75_00980 [Candidatus Omnitrophota bacterium]